jgi:translation initiation factor 1
MIGTVASAALFCRLEPSARYYPLIKRAGKQIRRSLKTTDPALHAAALSTDGGPGLSHNPFDVLSVEGLPLAPANPPINPGRSAAVKPAKKNRGRVDILRVKAGRGGKTVTVIKNFTGIGLPEKEHLAKTMQCACGAGGTVKNGQIEIQGDKREEVARILIEANFHPVFAGG